MFTKAANTVANALYRKFYLRNHPKDTKALQEYFDTKFDKSKNHFIHFDAPEVPLTDHVVEINPKTPFYAIHKKLKRLNKLYDYGGGYAVEDKDNTRRMIHTANPKRWWGRKLLRYPSANPTDFNIHMTHELDESDTYQKNNYIDKKNNLYGNTYILKKDDETGIPVEDEYGKVLGNYQLKGIHAGVDILGHESNHVLDASKSAHPHDLEAANRYKQTREETGEAAILKKLTGKQYGVDRFTKKDLNNLRLAPSFSDPNTVNFRSPHAFIFKNPDTNDWNKGFRDE